MMVLPVEAGGEEAREFAIGDEAGVPLEEPRVVPERGAVDEPLADAWVPPAATATSGAPT